MGEDSIKVLLINTNELQSVPSNFSNFCENLVEFLNLDWPRMHISPGVIQTIQATFNPPARYRTPKAPCFGHKTSVRLSWRLC